MATDNINVNSEKYMVNNNKDPKPRKMRLSHLSRLSRGRKSLAPMLARLTKNQDGDVSPEDVVGFVESFKDLNKQHFHVKLGFLIVCVMLLLSVVINGFSMYYVVDSAKDFRPNADGELTVSSGTPVAVDVSKAVVALGELSRADLNYLDNLETVTLASNQKVHHFEITGFTLHNQDNLDLYTNTETVIKIQCGRVRINWADGKFEDADEAHPQGRSLAINHINRPLSYHELINLVHKHIEPSLRKRILRKKNPLETIHSFFGGLAKSESSSQLYGELIKKGDCVMPPSIISITRPRIPVDSRWYIETYNDDENKLHTENWYMSYSDGLKIHFEQPQNCQWLAVTHVDGVRYEFEKYDKELCEFKGCPQNEILLEMNISSCSEYNNILEANRPPPGQITNCVREEDVENIADYSVFEVKIIDVLNSKSIWQLGVWIMEVDNSGTPIGIRSNLWTNQTFFKVIKIESFDPIASSIFSGCNPDDRSYLEHHENVRRRHLEHHENVRRKLLLGPLDLSGYSRGLQTSYLLHDIQAKLTQTVWCGSASFALSNFIYEPCPGSSDAEYQRGNNYDAKTDKACYRHDHSAAYDGCCKLSCSADKDLVDNTNSVVVKAWFGRFAAPGNAIGCIDYGKFRSGWSRRKKWKFITKRGPWRFNDIQTDFGYVKNKRGFVNDVDFKSNKQNKFILQEGNYSPVRSPLYAQVEDKLRDNNCYTSSNQLDQKVMNCPKGTKVNEFGDSVCKVTW